MFWAFYILLLIAKFGWRTLRKKLEFPLEKLLYRKNLWYDWNMNQIHRFWAVLTFGAIVQIGIMLQVFLKVFQNELKYELLDITPKRVKCFFPFQKKVTCSQKVKWLSQGYSVSRNQS